MVTKMEAMKNVLQLPGYRVCEYMLVLDPTEELRERVVKLREEFQQTYRSNAVSGRPNIMLASFAQYALMEERLINKLNLVAMGHYPFKVELKDYGSFPAHTIYINVVSKSPVQELVKTIRTNAQALMKLHDDRKPYFALEPTMNKRLAGICAPAFYRTVYCKGNVAAETVRRR